MSDQNYKTAKAITFKAIGIEIPVGGGDYLNKTIALVTGKASGYGLKLTNYGESVRLDGSFMIANLGTGEVVEGSSIYLPNDYAQSIANMLDKNNGAEVLIGDSETPLEIHCAESDKAARGYTFVVREASTPQVIASKNEMANALVNTMKKLPKPETKAKNAA